MQPAQPAPESLPPRKPGAASAASIRASSAGELFSKSSRLEACEADISRPNAAMSPRLQGLDPLAHPLVLAQDVPGPLAADRVEVAPSRPRAARARATRAGTRRDGESGRGTPPRRARTRPACWSYIPSASRREVFESHTTIAGAGVPSGSRSWTRVSQSRNRAWSARPKRLENWSSRPEPTPTNSFSDRRSVMASSMRSRSPLIAVEVAARSARDEAELDQEPGDRRLEARRAGEAGPERDIADDRRLEARRERPAPLGQGPADAADIAGPGPGLGALDRIEREGVGLVEVDRVDRASRPADTPAHDDRRPIDGRGHDQAAVVVGVVAQQLDPAGSTAQRRPARRRTGR